MKQLYPHAPRGAVRSAGACFAWRPDLLALLFLLPLLVLAGPAARAADDAALAWRVGMAVAKITPERPMMLAGFASRKQPSEGTALDLFAKALALEDASGGRFVIVTLDLIGVPRPLYENVAGRLQEAHGLSPAALLINASHTHCGPELAMTPSALAELSDERKHLTVAYCGRLEETLVELVGRALADLAPARLNYSHARCGFAMSRRLKNPDAERFLTEPYLNHPNPDGPVDHDLPVLQILGQDGKLRGALFGYACHNTVMWENVYSGDYSGFAQKFWEEDHPGAVSFFLTGCGGDQCGYPRGTLKHALAHGRTLATAIDAALGNKPRPVHGPLIARAERVEIEYAAPLGRASLESAAAGRPDAAAIRNELNVEHARRLLGLLERGEELRSSYDYPVQTLRFGEELILVALAGEVVVDYALRLKRELAGPADVWVAGYSHDVFAYIPSRRLLEEGGYEPRRSMNWMTSVVQPGPFAPSIEERIIGKTRELLEKQSGK